MPEFTATDLEIINRENSLNQRGLENFADAVNYFNEQGAEIQDVSKIVGDGWSQITNKHNLVGVPFIVVEAKFLDGRYGPFVFMKIVTQQNIKGYIVDGSTGIYAQALEIVQNSGKIVPMYCPRGLTVSEYQYSDESGVEHPATTFYFDINA